MDSTRKPKWIFGVLFISLLIDVANVFRLVHGPVPFPFFVPWVVARLVTLYLSFSRPDSHALRIVLWIILSLAVLLLSILSDGTNLSLWVWIALIIGPVSTVPSRQVAAGILGLAHIVTQLILLPLPTHDAPLSYIIIQVTGLVGLLLWHQWQRPPRTQEQAL
ncbi:MAG: hypothetical protein C7B45_15315 [Sulfobacillus acidophilus]|uniref:Uncharacterized protein n=1 Tax=Sulfobacillus acidophilus TaxID=53633 RepID=A0A2T2WDQ2_9FIRM|nr:MAG: hypothetical protein C7B45_15315 [Sulfobacillus acidophilus]